jgi:hypothetical protein
LGAFLATSPRRHDVWRDALEIAASPAQKELVEPREHASRDVLLRGGAVPHQRRNRNQPPPTLLFGFYLCRLEMLIDLRAAFARDLAGLDNADPLPLRKWYVFHGFATRSSALRMRA